MLAGVKLLCINFVLQWNQIDEATGLTGTHSELSALTKEHTQVFTLSMWDIRRKFRCVMMSLVIYDIMMMSHAWQAHIHVCYEYFHISFS